MNIWLTLSIIGLCFGAIAVLVYMDHKGLSFGWLVLASLGLILQVAIGGILLQKYVFPNPPVFRHSVKIKAQEPVFTYEKAIEPHKKAGERGK